MSVGFLSETPSGHPGYKVPIEEAVICILNKQKKRGVLKFIGETKFSSGVWCGVALREPCGKNDGCVAGVRYFECDEHHGIFVTPKNVFPDNPDGDLKLPEISSNPAVKGEECLSINLNKQENETSDTSLEDSRPRSKSDAVLDEKKNVSNIFSNSPFKCNIRDAKSSSLSKLNNVTYICSSPVLSDTDSKNVCVPRHSSPLLPSQERRPREVCNSPGNDDLAPHNVSSALHHCNDLSPKFEVKQAIKLGSINSARFPAPAGVVKDQVSSLNKTFLVRKESPRLENKPESFEQTSETKSPSDSDEKASIKHDMQKQDTISSSNQENPNVTFVSNNESDGENGRPRSVSKSSWSSMESLSSVGSMKSNRERSRLNGTKTPRKLPCPSECSKSKLVKISAEKKQKPKLTDKESAADTQEKPAVLKSANKPLTDDVLAKKSRTKSTSVVAPRSALATPAASKSATMKSKSKSVSSDFRDGQPQTRTRLNSSKFATPLASKISAPASSRLTSTPIAKKSALEKKSKLGTTGVKIRGSSITSLQTSNCENEQRSISRENSEVENKNSSLQVKNKIASSGTSVKKEKETKAAVNRSKTLSTTSNENKPPSAKSRTVSTSAAYREYKPITARARNLSTSCSTKDETKPPISKIRNMSTSHAEGVITKTYGLRSSIKSPAVSSVSGNVTSHKPLPQSRKIKTDEQLPLKERQKSAEAIQKRNAKEKVESTDTELRSVFSSAATPDILKQTPEITRHSVALQVDTLQNDNQETSQSSKEQEKADAFLSALVQRNREFEACLVALQVYAQKVDHECENASILRKNLKFTKERYYSTENMLVKESSQRARLEEEMLSAKSDSVVEVALLRVQYERKQEITLAKLKEAHKKDLDKVRKQHTKSMEDVKNSCDLKLKRIEETYVQDIAQINEKHRDVIAELELQHSNHVDELVEERHAEIETIKADYDEQLERIQESLSESVKRCNEMEATLRITEQEAKRDIELRIQDAIAKYKSLPDELESMKFVLELKNNEVKKLRKSNAELHHQIDELQQIKERASLLEREKESLNFVVENKAHFERQLSMERDKLRLSLDREVAMSKRLSLEKEELAWRLNSFQNSPTSPTMNNDRFSWRGSGFSSPDSAVYSQKIEESDFEFEMNESKEIES